MKKTATAPSNIALIKYWGKKDEALRLPDNGSISVNLSGIYSTTTVEFSTKYLKDQVIIDQKEIEKETQRVSKHLDRIRKRAGIFLYAKVISSNNFPKALGLASSASGFAALTKSASKAAGLNLSEKELTILARLGSGSACRSIPNGFVEWIEGKNSETSYASSIFSKNFWDLSILVVIVRGGEKKVSSTDGHRLARTSPFFETRLKNINKKIVLIKQLIKEKNFTKFGELVESEALEMHTIMLTSNPALIFWQPATVEVMKFVHKLRAEKLPVYFTIDAGAHLFLICEKKNEKEIVDKLKRVEQIERIIINHPADGTRIIED